MIHSSLTYDLLKTLPPSKELSQVEHLLDYTFILNGWECVILHTLNNTKDPKKVLDKMLPLAPEWVRKKVLSS